MVVSCRKHIESGVNKRRLDDNGPSSRNGNIVNDAPASATVNEDIYYAGVYWHAKSARFRAQIYVGGRSEFLMCSKSSPDPFAEVFPLRQPDARFDAFVDGWLADMEAAL